MPLIKAKRICIVDTVYSLLLYLLLSSKNDIDHTFFIFQKGIPKGVRDKFIDKKFFNDSFSDNKLRFVFYSFYYRAWRLLYKFSKDAEFFALDHIRSFSLLIGKHKYNLLADGPRCYSSADTKIAYSLRRENVLRKILLDFIVGKLRRKFFGRNSQCKRIILGEPDYADFLRQEIIELSDLRKNWQAATEEKKAFILDVFEVSKEVCESLEHCSSILLTQQFSSDGVITEKEQIEIYKASIADFDKSKLVIKPHPRDYVPYEKYFPECLVVRSSAPMQLLALLGCKFEKVITVYSSACMAFPEAELVWLGTEVHPALNAMYGTQPMPTYRD